MKKRDVVNRINKKILIIIITAFMVTPCVVSSQDRSRLEEPGERRRNGWHPPVKIMDTMGLESSMSIGDLGAGRGRFTVWFADRVGESGRVYANDIDKNALDYNINRCRKLGFDNVSTILGEVDDPCFPKGSLDIVFVVGTYHHLEKPVELMRNVIPALKEGGKLVIIEYDPEKTGDTSGRSSTTRDKIILQIEQAGFEVIKIETFLERDNMYIGIPRRGSIR
ncbi:MAG: class I SAM-dependent methyltransferase [bacterium]|nr:class I SAM-dependent methyltransferase [bacterium]